MVTSGGGGKHLGSKPERGQVIWEMIGMFIPHKSNWPVRVLVVLKNIYQMPLSHTMRTMRYDITADPSKYLSFALIRPGRPSSLYVSPTVLEA